ncbi:MAG: lysophospholipid acyltransferase family protein [Chloroflexota bacterium]|nr:lysophospholipid acyltransferase family protein [Chloroflexota bacterium]
MTDLRARVTALGLRLGVSVLRALPDRIVFQAAYTAGTGLSLVMTERRALVRANLRQVCRGLIEAGLASDRVRRAATDESSLERMVRSAFGNWVQGYAESAVIPAYSADELRQRIPVPGDPVVAAALASLAPGPPGRIFISAHFGTVELAGFYAVGVAGMRLSAPMETVADPALQAYFERTRGARGIALVPIRGASVPLRGALQRGEAIALVADRVIGGSGMPVRLMGAPARLPLGPAVLALESEAPCFVVGMQRTGWGHWTPHIERLPRPSPGTLRERIDQHLEAQARAFERMIAQAPEQWWTVHFPIWPAKALDATLSAPPVEAAA